MSEASQFGEGVMGNSDIVVKAMNAEVVDEPNRYHFDIPEDTTPAKIIKSLVPNKFSPLPIFHQPLNPRTYDTPVRGFPDEELNKTIVPGKFDAIIFSPGGPHSLEDLKSKIKSEFGDTAELPDPSTMLYILANRGKDIMKQDPIIMDSHHNGQRFPVDMKFQKGTYAVGINFTNQTTNPSLAEFGYAGPSETFNRAFVVIRK